MLTAPRVCLLPKGPFLRIRIPLAGGSLVVVCSANTMGRTDAVPLGVPAEAQDDEVDDEGNCVCVAGMDAGEIISRRGERGRATYYNHLGCVVRFR